MRRGLLTIMLACAAAAGCIDFVEPDIAELGAPAVIDAVIRVDDRGNVSVEAELEPGLDAAGFRRAVKGELTLTGRVIPLDVVLRGGAHRYVDSWLTTPDVAGRQVTLSAPTVESVGAPPPVIEWYGLQRAGPDTVDIATGEDLLLPLALTEGEPKPEPQIRQWFLNLSTESGSSFTVSANGPPPDTLYVPARWIPNSPVTEVRLIVQQSVVLREPPGDYIGRITLDTRLYWTLRLQPGDDTLP